MWVFGPDQCVIEDLDVRVSDCDSNLDRRVVHQWSDDAECDGGLRLPADRTFACSKCLGFRPSVVKGHV